MPSPVSDIDYPDSFAIQRRAIAYVVAGHVNPRVLSFEDGPAQIVALCGTPGSAAYGRTVIHAEWPPELRQLENPSKDFMVGGLDIQVDCTANDVLHSEWLNWDISVGISRVVYEFDRTADAGQTADSAIQAIQRRAIAFVKTFRLLNPRVVAYEETPEDVVALYGMPGSARYGRTAVHVDWAHAHRAITGTAEVLNAGIVFEVDSTAHDVIHYRRMRAEFI
jgi:hypothetical protein